MKTRTAMTQSSISIHLPISYLKEWSKALDVSESSLSKTLNPVIVFTLEDEPTKKVSEPVAKKNESQEVKSDEVHICERVPRGKKDKCGKKAKMSICSQGKTHWYCGSEKSGCYKSAKNALNVVDSVVNKVKTQPNKEKKTVEEIKKQTLLDKVTEKKNFTTSKVLVDGKELHICTANRVLFNAADSKAYGVLSDTDKVMALGDKEKRWLDANGLTFTTIESPKVTEQKESAFLENLEAEDTEECEEEEEEEEEEED